jgi:hypothetical protein
MAKRDPNVIQNVKENVNHVVDAKNKEIMQLHFEIGKIRKVMMVAWLLCIRMIIFHFS